MCQVKDDDWKLSTGNKLALLFAAAILFISIASAVYESNSGEVKSKL